MAEVDLAAETDPAAKAAPGVRIANAAPRGQITLRGDAGNPAFGSAIQSATGLVLPAMRGVTETAGRRMIWFSPDEWLITCPPGETADLLSALEEALAGQHFAAIDTTDARTVIEVAGAGAREVLMKHTPVDLSPEAFPAGSFRRTHLSEVAAAFHLTNDTPPTFEVYVFRSYADFLTALLEKTAHPNAVVRLFG